MEPKDDFPSRRDRGRLDLIRSAAFPLRSGKNAWRFALLPVFAFFVPLGLIPMRGWRLDVVRQSVREGREAVPTLAATGRHLVDGALLWVLRGVFLVPLSVFLALFAYDTITVVLEFADWVVARFLERGPEEGPAPTLSDVRASLTAASIKSWLVPGLYVICVWPVYRACVIRYAITGNPSSLFRIDKAVSLVVRHFDGFLAVFGLWVLLRVLIEAPLFIALVASVVGAPLVPLVLLPFHFWTTAHLYASLALRITAREADGSSKALPTDAGVANDRAESDRAAGE